MKYICVLLMFTSAASYGQTIGQGATEMQIWTSEGYSVSGGRGDTGIWNAGLRYGWVLTEPHGPGFLAGRFEYAIDAVPMYLIFQPRGTAYGVGVNPINLKWNFATRGRVRRTRGRSSFHNRQGSARDFKSQFHAQRSLWHAFAATKICMDH
jgi:hypothetical protein